MTDTPHHRTAHTTPMLDLNDLTPPAGLSFRLYRREIALHVGGRAARDACREHSLPVKVL